MKSRLLRLLAATIILLVGLARAGFAQDDLPSSQPYNFPGPAVDVNLAMQESIAGLTLPMWQRSNVMSFSTYNSDGTYTCTDGSRCDIVPTMTLLGRDPAVAGPPPNNITQIPTTIVPLVLNFRDRNNNIVLTFDPSASSACPGLGNQSLSNLTLQSPLFADFVIQPPYWNIFYDHPQQKTQFVDAQMRSEFYSWMSAQNPWHNKLLPTLNSPITRDVPWGSWGVRQIAAGGCGARDIRGNQWLGIVDDQWLDPVLRNIANTIGTTKFAFFITWNVIERDVTQGTDYLGYHNAYGNPPQVYAIAPFDTSKRFFMADVSVMAHELGETMNNPLVSTAGNATPGWNINRGLARPVSCQYNFEVGDPVRILRGTSGHSVTAPNGFTYHLQEIAFAGWFYRIAGLGIPWPNHPSPAYSTNGTFTTDAGIACTP